MTTTAAEATRLTTKVTRLKRLNCEDTAALARTTQDVEQLRRIKAENAKISRISALALSYHTSETLTPQLEKALKEIESLKARLVVANRIAVLRAIPMNAD